MPDAAALAAQYAPILWVHETDHFLPEDYRAYFSAATIRLCRGREPLRTISDFEELLTLDATLNAPEFYLDIAEIDLWELRVATGWTRHNGGLGGQGFESVREAARKALGNNPHVHTGWYDPDRVAAFRPRVYWRLVDAVQVPTGIPGLAAGRRHVLQYFFFSIYNDYFNQHECDWDATLQLFVTESGEVVAASYSFHEDTWLVAPADGGTPVRDWLAQWPDPETLARRTQSGQLPLWQATPGRGRALHPWNVIASGSHGGYPTPGYMNFEAAVPDIPGEQEGGRLRISSDDRAIARTCIFPQWSVSEHHIREQLRTGGVRDDRLRPIGYAIEDMEMVDPVHGFAAWRGHWGEHVPSPSWNGPIGPIYQQKWIPGTDTWAAYLAKANTFGGVLQQVGKTTHDVMEHDKLEGVRDSARVRKGDA